MAPGAPTAPGMEQGTGSMILLAKAEAAEALAAMTAAVLGGGATKPCRPQQRLSLQKSRYHYDIPPLLSAATFGLHYHTALSSLDEMAA